MSGIRWRILFLCLSRTWVVGGPNNETCGYFRTLPEAHTYAMKLSRTVEVELPPVNPDQSIQGDYEGSFPLRVRRNWYGGTSLSIPGARTFAITHEERKSLPSTYWLSITTTKGPRNDHETTLPRTTPMVSIRGQLHGHNVFHCHDL